MTVTAKDLSDAVKIKPEVAKLILFDLDYTPAIVAAATISALSEYPGVGPKKAEKIKEWAASQANDVTHVEPDDADPFTPDGPAADPEPVFLKDQTAFEPAPLPPASPRIQRIRDSQAGEG